MGNRIVIDITDGRTFTPSFYGHWCGLRAVKVLNDTVRSFSNNGINSLMCSFITNVMGNQPREYSFYLYNHGEAEGSADWDNYTWTFHTDTCTWTTTDPEFTDREFTMEEADRHAMGLGTQGA